MAGLGRLGAVSHLPLKHWGNRLSSLGKELIHFPIAEIWNPPT